MARADCGCLTAPASAASMSARRSSSPCLSTQSTVADGSLPPQACTTADSNRRHNTASLCDRAQAMARSGERATIFLARAKSSSSVAEASGLGNGSSAAATFAGEAGRTSTAERSGPGFRRGRPPVRPEDNKQDQAAGQTDHQPRQAQPVFKQLEHGIKRSRFRRQDIGDPICVEHKRWRESYIGCRSDASGSQLRASPRHP